MCGIAAIYDTAASSETRLQDSLGVENILKMLKHRGPDGSGSIQQGPSSFGHRRLAIVDIEGGSQPMVMDRPETMLVCNGEIYNHIKIRNKYRKLYSFGTESDSEAILALYKHTGDFAVHALEGMFALLLSDGDGLFAARDPLGIKPLYYGRQGERMKFASEAKALVGEVDTILEFPPGTMFSSGSGFRRYHSFHPPKQYISDEQEAVQLVRESLEESVRSHMLSDVPVGVFLSGGLDSSIIAALAARHVSELHTFAVGMKGSPDLDCARKVAAYLGTVHHEKVIEESEVLNRLDRIIYYLESADPALIRSAVPCYFVSQLAAEMDGGEGGRVKVVLTGEGADELFAGYDYLASFTSGRQLEKELFRLINGLHNLNLQRLDRMTMAHGLEGRVPFLDRTFLARSMSIHPSLKLPRRPGGPKALLRRAFEDLLPRSIAERPKLEFAQGASTSGFLSGFAGDEQEDAHYRRIFDGFFGKDLDRGALGTWRGPLL